MRAKPIQPSNVAKKIATEILRDLCFRSYAENDVLRVARRITKGYQQRGAELMRPDDGNPFNVGFTAGIKDLLEIPREQ